MNGVALGTLIIIVSLVLVVILYRRPIDEGYTNIGSWHTPNYRPEYTNERDEYIARGQGNYNDFGGVLDTSRGNFMRATTDQRIADVNKALKEVAITTMLTPSTDSPTGLATQPIDARILVPKTNKILENARKCEALKGRDQCKVLGTTEGKDCGVCIKGGTRYEDDEDGKHIGGMYVMPDDVEIAKMQGKAVQPTLGECPPGFFFIDRASCEKGVNRIECAESGETGGFTGRTLEGKQVALDKCAMSSQTGFEKVMVYEPKDRKFNALLRFVTPLGTGRCTMQISYDGSTRVNQVFEKPGLEYVVSLPGVTEGLTVDISVTLESVHRPFGMPEVYQVRGNAHYALTREEGMDLCARLGARMATKEELATSQARGAQLCSAGWTTNDQPSWPMQTQRDGCGSVGITRWTPASGRANVWCYGAKPAKGANDAVYDFFAPVNGGTPAQDGRQSIWSEHAAGSKATSTDIEMPGYRAIIMQWEMFGDTKKRSTSFEPTIVKINDMDPANIATDGTRTFKNLRRYGTFRNSKTIMGPRPRAETPLVTNQFWIWGPSSNQATVKYTAQVPGILMDPFYPEDRETAGVTRGPLLGKPTSAVLLRVGACMREGQEAGKYSIECLTSLFVSAGGDALRGLLAIENGGLMRLNKYGDMDAIGEFLNNIYQVATTGRDANGVLVGKDAAQRQKIINDASQQMFGFDISSPCEEISTDARGNVTIVPKSKPDVWCLDHLWTNTGSDKSRGAESALRQSGIKNTYINIGDRYSGLRNDESSLENRKKTPFRTCTREGALAPLDNAGRRNEEAIRIALSKGNIQQIQDFYDSIFQGANKSNFDRGYAALDAHALVIKQCFGLEKSPDAPPKCPKTFDLMKAYSDIVPTPPVAQPAAVKAPAPPAPPPPPITCPHGNKAGIAVAYKQEDCLPPPPPPPPPPVPIPPPPPPAPRKVGINARYIRIIPPHNLWFGNERYKFNHFPFEVYDNDKEIAKDKRAIINRNRVEEISLSEGVNAIQEADPRTFYIEIDLSSTKQKIAPPGEGASNITRITYDRLTYNKYRRVPGMDLHTPIIFLDSSRNVVAVRYVMTNPFAPLDMQITPPEEPNSILLKLENKLSSFNPYGKKIALTPANGPNIQYARVIKAPSENVRSLKYYDVEHFRDSNEALYFIIEPAITGQPWPYFSLRSADPTAKELYVRGFGWLDKDARYYAPYSARRYTDDDIVDRGHLSEQTFKFVKPANGDPTCISIQLITNKGPIAVFYANNNFKDQIDTFGPTNPPSKNISYFESNKFKYFVERWEQYHTRMNNYIIKKFDYSNFSIKLPKDSKLSFIHNGKVIQTITKDVPFGSELSSLKGLNPRSITMILEGDYGYEDLNEFVGFSREYYSDKFDRIGATTLDVDRFRASWRVVTPDLETLKQTRDYWELYQPPLL